MSNLLGVADNSEQNAHTYVYEPDKSLRKMTMEAFPDALNYEKEELEHAERPTIDEILSGEKRVVEDAVIEDVEQKSGKVIKFGWIEGVFMRCLLNIWGTMLFLRLTWVVGQCGIWQGLLVITLANIVTLLSALSMSAIATNGQIPGGGVYYMISRALGPALGGSIGLMFTIANTISVATYTVGFSESLLDLLQDAVPGWNGIVEHDCTVAGCRNNDVRIIGTPTLVLFLVIAFAGMDWVTRVQKALLVLLILAQLDMFAGSFIDIEFGSGYIQLENDTFGHIGQSLRHSLGYTGWSIDTAEINLNPQYTNSPMSSGNQPDFAEVFGVFFTAVTGIVAGANLSGDLKDPSSAIPKGTLWAIGFTYVTYFFFAICTGFTYLPQASGIAEEYNFHGLGGDSILGSYNGTAEFPLGFPRWDDCSAESNAIRDMYTNATSFPALEYIYKEWQEGKGCLHGSAMDQMTMTYICFTGYLRYAGGFSASLSSAIASLVGAPRVLQAVGKDKIYPFANFFAKGYTANNDPFRGYILVFVIAFAFVMIASLNEISVIASNFFLAAYALMNLSCFHSSMTKSPGWRPSFKFYNPWVALASTFLCVGMMFVLSPMYAGITIGIILVLGVYILWMDPEANWGSSTQAQTFLSALKSTREITNAPDHIKTYRPKILLFSGNPAHRPSLVDFAHLITKKTSLLICGDVMDEQNIKPIPTMREHVQAWLKDHNLNAFYNPTIGSNFEEGAKNCILNAGLGKLSPNMVLMGFKNDWRTDLKGLDAYVNTMYNSFDANMAVGIMRVEGGCDFSGTIGSEQITEVKVKKSDVVDDEDQGLGVPGVKRMRKVSSYHSPDGQKLSSTVVSNIQQFREKHTGFIDVWWLYDDGGLTLLLPYIIQTRKIYKDCTLRVFSLATRTDQLVAEQRSLATLLAKFRIEFSDVIIIPDVTKKADPSTKAEFDAMISGMPSDVMTESILQEEREKTNRHLRLAELMREHSKRSEMVVITLPLPRRNKTPSPLYAAWLDIMTKGLPPTLLIRGNQQSVLTFYS